MIALVLSAVLALQAAPAAVPRDADIALVLDVARDLSAGRDDAARTRASADPATARAAFDEAIADAAMARLHDQPAAYANSDRLVGVLAAATGDPAATDLASRIARVAPGTDPFREDAGGVEGALRAYCAIGAGDTDDPAASLAERRRAESALDAARGSGSAVLTCACLTWLGTYAFQGGDMAVARRYLTEAVTFADAAALDRARVELRRTVAASRALDGDAGGALTDLESALAVVEALGASGPDAPSLAVDVAADAAGLARRLEARDRAVGVVERADRFLERVGAPGGVRADSAERLGQMHAQAAAGNPVEARRAAAALDRAAALRVAAGERDRGAITLTAAGVLLLENVSGSEARPVFERALAMAGGARNESLRAGVEYWLGRAWLADGDAASTEKAAGLFATALRRLDSLAREGSSAPDLRVRLLHWLGRARSGNVARDLTAARDAFARAFDAALDGGLDVNDAVVSAEQALRCRAGLGDARSAGADAIRFYDRLAATKRIDPVNAASALAAELQRSATDMGTQGVASTVLALWDHVAEAGGEVALRARLALVNVASARRDAALLGTRADGVFEALVAAKRDGEAESLAESVWLAWTDAGDSVRAGTWRVRYEPLAEASFRAAREGKRPEAAIRSADGLARAARTRGDAAGEATWLGERDGLRRGVAEEYEKDGKLGLASESFQGLGSDLMARGAVASARECFERAAALAERSNDREARAEALAGRAGAELAAGDAAQALATTADALRLATTSAMATAETLPSVSEVTLPGPAAAALRVRADAFQKLGNRDLAAAARQRADEVGAAQKEARPLAR